MVRVCRHGRSPFVDFVIVLYMVWECRHGRSPFVDFAIILSGADPVEGGASVTRPPPLKLEKKDFVLA